jgi:hypothetical protein
MDGVYRYFGLDKASNRFMTDGGFDATVKKRWPKLEKKYYDAITRALNKAFRQVEVHNRERNNNNYFYSSWEFR